MINNPVTYSYNLIDEVDNSDDLIIFVKLLHNDFQSNKESWENWSIEHCFSSIFAFLTAPIHKNKYSVHIHVIQTILRNYLFKKNSYIRNKPDEIIVDWKDSKGLLLEINKLGNQAEYPSFLNYLVCSLDVIITICEYNDLKYKELAFILQIPMLYE